MNLKLIFLTSLIAIGFAFSATAGSIDDSDFDGIPDVFDNCEGIPITTRANDFAANFDTDGDGLGDGCDNCTLVKNGPGELSNQVDTDGDGYGNACDTDYDQDGQTLASDAVIFLSVFPSAAAESGLDLLPDATGDLFVLSNDAQVFLSFFPAGVPGPSGYGCADPLDTLESCRNP